MRYLDEVTFIKKPEEVYNPDIGEYETGELVKIVLSVNVTDLGTNRRMELFGDIAKKRKVIRFSPLQNVPTFDYIEFKGDKWRLETSINPDKVNSLIVSKIEGSDV